MKKRMIVLGVLCVLALLACDEKAEPMPQEGAMEATSESQKTDEATPEEAATEPTPAEPTDFLQFRWGMTKDEVVEALDTLDYREPTPREVRIDTKWLGFGVQRTFLFDDETKELYWIAHKPEQDYDEGPRYLMSKKAWDHYTKINRVLKREFGEFESDDVNFSDTNFAEIESTGIRRQRMLSAMEKSQYARHSSLKTDEYVIHHNLSMGQNMQNLPFAIHGINVYSPDAGEAGYEQSMRTWEFHVEGN